MKLTEIKKLAELDFYTEGPAVGTDGAFYFTTLSGRTVFRIGTDGKTEPWAEGACPNGQAIRADGTHWFCESRDGRISSHHSDGRFEKVVLDGVCAGVGFSTPNDLIFDSAGNLYFTDSIRENGKVFFLGADGTEKVIADGIDYANGLALSPSETTLYVSESYGNRVLAVDLSANSQPRRTVLADLPKHPSNDPVGNLPDGLGTDNEGRIWVAHYGMQAVHVISPEGKLVDSFDTGLPLTSNLAFVSDTQRLKQLLITGGFGEPGPGAVVLATISV